MGETWFIVVTNEVPDYGYGGEAHWVTEVSSCVGPFHTREGAVAYADTYLRVSETHIVEGATP